MEGHTLITVDDVCASTQITFSPIAPMAVTKKVLCRTTQAIDAVDIANNNVLTSTGTRLMSGRKHPNIFASYLYLLCVCCFPSTTNAGMESPSGPRLGKLSSSGLPRGRTPKHGHPQESVRITPGPENNSNKHSEWLAAALSQRKTVCGFRSLQCFFTDCLKCGNEERFCLCDPGFMGELRRGVICIHYDIPTHAMIVIVFLHICFYI